MVRSTVNSMRREDARACVLCSGRYAQRQVVVDDKFHVSEAIEYAVPIENSHVYRTKTGTCT